MDTNFYKQTARVGIVKSCLRFVEDPRRPFWQRLLLALTPLFLIYVISPLDLFPEAILGPLGLTDDSIIIISMFFLIRLAASFYNEKRYVKPRKFVENSK